MSQIFISYAAEDRDFAMKLTRDLDDFFGVWIDRDDLKGGHMWEQAIDTAIRECSLFLAIVSSHSNASTWVTRETIRAENLSKYRIPVLLDGELPLRLLELQYVDFRGDYSGGFRDLLEIIRTRLAPDLSNQSNIDQMIGAAMRLFFDGKPTTAQNLMEQVRILRPESAEMLDWVAVRLMSPDDKLRRQPLAPQLAPAIRFVEKARLLDKNIYPGDDQAYEWSLEVAADDKTLSQIEYVKYLLHPTFVNPERIIRSRETHFKLLNIGWGLFRVMIEVGFVDGSLHTTHHDLTFPLDE